MFLPKKKTYAFNIIFIIISQLSLSKNIATEQGNNLAKAYEYQAFGTLFSSALQAKPLMPNPSTGTKSVLSPQFRRVGYGNTSGVYT